MPVSAEPVGSVGAYVPRLVGQVEAQPGPAPLRFDGTLVCADLSGFTRLTERLASFGQEGAEAVSEIVNASLAAVLEPALGAGGDVLYFGGDAVSVLYEGADHRDRAIAAAAAMQRALDARAAVESAAGAVRLRMSVGVASGEITALLAGRDQRALVVLGAAATACVDLQHRARAGQVLADGATGPRAVRWRSRAVGAAISPVAEPVADPSLLPPALRDVLGGSPPPPELRRTTTAFLLAHQLGAEPDVAAAVVDAVEAGAERWGVCWLATDLGAGGITFVLAAGSPVAVEDPDDAMVRAVRSAIAAAPAGSLRAGIEQGVVFAGDIGHPTRRTWTVIGDSVNVAARLAARAAPGRVLAGPTILASSRRPFRATPVGELTVKGRRREVAAARLDLAPEPADAPIGSGPVPTVGMAQERAALGAAWTAAALGHGRVVDVVGAAGAGKSHLLAELRTGAGAEVTTVVQPDLYRGSVPYATASALVRAVTGIDPEASGRDAGTELQRWVATSAPHLLPWLPLLADAADAIVEPTDAVDRLGRDWVADRRHAAVVDLLHVAQPGPWLLVVEDAHRIDEASRRLLDEVALAASTRPWLLCVARRPETTPLEPTASDLLEVPPLTTAEATELVIAAADPTALSDATVARVVAAAGGNPLFLHALATHVIGGDGEGDDVPRTVERVLSARIDRLLPAERRLLREASVTGGTAAATQLAALLDDPGLAEADRWLPLGAFVEVADGVVRFRDDLVRAVAYQGLPFRRRRELHAAMAGLLAAEVEVGGSLGDDTVGLLAAHLLEAGDADRAWVVGIDAARRATAGGALLDAADIYRRTLAVAPRVVGLQPTDAGIVHEELGLLHDRLGRFDLALDAFATASRLLTDPLDRARLCSRRVIAEQHRGEYGRAQRWASRGLRLVEGRADEAAVAARAQLELDQAGTAHFLGRNRRSVRWAEHAMADALATDDPRLLANAYLHLELAHSVLSDGMASAYGDKAIALFEEIGDQKGLGDALANSGITAYNEGRWHDAARCYARAVEVIGSIGDVTQGAVVAMNTGFLLAEQGETEAAARLVPDAERAFRAAGHEVFLGFIERLKSTLSAWAGHHDRAAELLAGARVRFVTHDASQMVLDCDVARVEQLLRAGRAGDAAAEAGRLVGVIDDFGPAELLPVTIRRLHALALTRTGDGEAALPIARTALEAARDHGARFEVALCLDAVAHALLATGVAPDAELLAERDQILRDLAVRRTVFSLAR